MNKIPIFIKGLIEAIFSIGRQSRKSSDMQRKLQESEERYRRLFDEATEGMGIADYETGIVLDCNQAFTRMLGYEKADLVGRPQTLLHPPENGRPQFSPTFARHRSDLSGQVLETRMQCKSGEIKDVEIKAQVLEMHGRKVVQGFFRDITARKRAEEALHESEYLFKESQRAAFIGSYKTDFMTGLWESSEVLDQIFGIDRAYRRTVLGWLDIVHPDDREMMGSYLKEQVLGRRQPFHKEYRIIRKSDGETRWVLGLGAITIDAAGTINAMIGTIQDITERKQAEAARLQLEEQIQQARKLEALGHLAGGVAHDLNNMLAPILGYGEIMLNELSADAPQREYLDEIIQAGERARDLVRQLLAFARKQTVEMKPLNLNRVIESLIKMLSRTLRENIGIEFHPDRQVGAIMGDIVQIEQILLNLAINAQDAMPDGGKLAIRTANVILNEQDLAGFEALSPGPYAMLTVGDTGLGMDQDTLARIFDPFFTTKPSGKGTGLGLATVYGIVRQLGGLIKVKSEPGQGTSFYCYFPRINAEPLPEPVSDRTSLPQGSETILLVEDQESVREMVRTALNRLGYRVLTASGGMAAMELATACGGGLQLLLTDVIMGDMNGRSLYQRLAEIQPGLKVLYMSGYTNDVIDAHGVLEKGIHFLQKPFSIQDLASKVREALNN